MSKQLPIIKTQEDLAVIFTHVVEDIFHILQSEDIALNKATTNKYGQLTIVVDTSADYAGHEYAEVLAEMMNKQDPYDLKGLVFDDMLFDINRPDWSDEHTSRCIEVTDADGLGPYHDDETVESYRITIDLDALYGYYQRVCFMRDLVNGLRDNSDVTKITIETSIIALIDGDDHREVFIQDVHNTTRMFNRTVVYNYMNSDYFVLFLHPVQ